MKSNRNQHKLKPIAALAAIVAATLLGGCTGVAGAISNSLDQTALQESTPMRPQAANASFSFLAVPAKTQVDITSIQTKGISQHGQIVIGEALPHSPRGQSKKGVTQAFRWDLKSNEWLWLGADEANEGSNPVGMSRAGDMVFGSQWVWQKNELKAYDLGRQFWAYALRDDGQLLGVELGSQVAIRSLDGKSKQSWPVADLFSVDAAGNVNEQYWFADNAVLISSNIHQCLTAQGCSQAQLMWWTPEEGKRVVNAQLPDYKNDFVQSNSGPQLVSSNGQWLIGSIGQSIYRWDSKGELLFLGGFQDGGTAVGISDDGKVAVGTTIDEGTGIERSWIWTQTEGLGWLDEWLRDHGIDKQYINPAMQVKLLSADRLVLIGVTPVSRDEKEAGNTEPPAPKWWRVDMSEHLRILI